MKNKMYVRAQAAIMGLLVAFMLVAVAAIITLPLLDFVAIGVNATVNATHGELMQTIIQILPVFMWLVVLVAVVALITGSQR